MTVADLAGEAGAHMAYDAGNGAGVDRAGFLNAFEDGGEVADRDSLGEQGLQHGADLVGTGI